MTIQNAVGTIRRIYVRPPDPQALVSWRDYAWRAAPDPVKAAEEHAALREALGADGAEVVVGETAVPGDPDAIYAYDPTLPTDRGVDHPSARQAGRRDEPAAVTADLTGAGLGLLGTLTPPATAEGGDMFWLDHRTLLVGRGYRTNDDGIEQIANAPR